MRGMGEFPRVGERPAAHASTETETLTKITPETEATAATPDAAESDAARAPKPEAASVETPALESGTTELDSSDDDDGDRATFPMLERARSPSPAAEPLVSASEAPSPGAEPLVSASEAPSPGAEPLVSASEASSPVPEPLVPNERSAPTQPPSRVARKPMQPAKPAAPDGQNQGSDGVAGFLVKSVLAAAAAFLATTWLVPVLLPDKEPTGPEEAPNVSEPPAAKPTPAPEKPATSPTIGTPATPAAFRLRSEAIATPPGVTLDPAQGLVEIELAEASSIKVDDSFVGRFDKRRSCSPRERTKSTSKTSAAARRSSSRSRPVEQCVSRPATRPRRRVRRRRAANEGKPLAFRGPRGTWDCRRTRFRVSRFSAGR